MDTSEKMLNIFIKLLILGYLALRYQFLQLQILLMHAVFGVMIRPMKMHFSRGHEPQNVV